MRQILGLLILVFISYKMGSTAVYVSRCLALVEGIVGMRQAQESLLVFIQKKKKNLSGLLLL